MELFKANKGMNVLDNETVMNSQLLFDMESLQIYEMEIGIYSSDCTSSISYGKKL